MAGWLAVVVKIFAAWSRAAASALTLEEIFPVGNARGVSLPSVCLMKTSPPPFFTAPSEGPSVKAWVHSMGLYLSSIIQGQGFHQVRGLAVLLFNTWYLRDN